MEQYRARCFNHRRWLVRLKSTTDNGYGWTYRTNAWSPLNALRRAAGDLTILALDLNDATGATSLAAYKANLQFMINQIKAAGGELLIGTEGRENNGSGANDATITLYVQAIYQVAATNGIPVVYNYSRQSRAAFVNTAGWLYTDNVHYNAQGYADIAEGYLRFLVSAL